MAHTPYKRPKVKVPYRGKRRVSANMRDQLIFELRELGYTYAQISEACKKKGFDEVSVNTCCQVVNRTLENIRTNSSETYENVRVQELGRLDRALSKAMEVLNKPRQKDAMKLMAVDRVAKLSERRVKMLGLEVQKIEEKKQVTVRIYEGLEDPKETE